MGGIYVVTADHGNAEDMVKRDKKGEPIVGKDGKVQILTSHTLQPVSNKYMYITRTFTFMSYLYFFGLDKKKYSFVLFTLVTITAQT